MPPKPAENAAAKRKAPYCKRCDRRIHVPKGWSPGAATRRHYWSKHRETMQGSPDKRQG